MEYYAKFKVKQKILYPIHNTFAIDCLSIGGKLMRKPSSGHTLKALDFETDQPSVNSISCNEIGAKFGFLPALRLWFSRKEVPTNSKLLGWLTNKSLCLMSE